MSFQVNPIIFRAPIKKKWVCNNIPKNEKFNILTIALNSFINNYLKKKYIYTEQQKTVVNSYEGKITVYVYYFTFRLPKNVISKKTEVKEKLENLKSLIALYESSEKNENLKLKILRNLKMLKLLKQKKVRVFDRLVRWQLQDEVYKYFKTFNIQIHVKNVLRSVNPLAFTQEKRFFKKYYKRFKSFKFYRRLLHIINIATYLKSTKILSEFLIHTLCYRHLRKQWKFIYTTIFFLEKFLYARPSIRGIKISIAGKINGSLRKKTFVRTFGSMPLHTLNTDIRYTENFHFSPRYGAFCLKLWFYI